MITPLDSRRAIERAFQNHRLPLVIPEVDAAYGYIGYYQPHIGKKLSGHGYSDKTDGHHVLKFDTTKRVSPNRLARLREEA